MKQYSENMAKAGNNKDEKSIPPFLKLQSTKIQMERTLSEGIVLQYRRKTSIAVKLLSSVLRFPFPNGNS